MPPVAVAASACFPSKRFKHILKWFEKCFYVLTGSLKIVSKISLLKYHATGSYKSCRTNAREFG
jgi:hypothetical protein